MSFYLSFGFRKNIYLLARNMEPGTWLFFQSYIVCSLPGLKRVSIGVGLALDRGPAHLRQCRWQNPKCEVWVCFESNLFWVPSKKYMLVGLHQHHHHHHHHHLGAERRQGKEKFRSGERKEMQKQILHEGYPTVLSQKRRNNPQADTNTTVMGTNCHK